MAGSREILLPEVHLNSPIIKHKLYYYILLGNLPNEIDLDDLGPLHNQNWNQILFHSDIIRFVFLLLDRTIKHKIILFIGTIQ